ncbi:MAG: hypothetical protein KGN36_03615, partial [Acidobacteriota bacterium]|nr:hypothetical protein [Acidobacteriota bacterium]
MKSLCIFAFAAAGLWAQTAPAPPAARLPNLPENEVVATFNDGTKVTMGDVKAFYGLLSPGQQQAIVRDPTEFLRQWGVMRRLAQIAVERKLDQQSPYKEALEQAR